MASLRTYRQNRLRYTAQRLWLAVAICMALYLVPAPGHAQNAPAANIIDLASLTLVPLSNQSISSVKGNYLEGPRIGNPVPSNGMIILWDELKPQMPSQNITSGNSTITINGAVK
jgi:hypothetical protein